METTPPRRRVDSTSQPADPFAGTCKADLATHPDFSRDYYSSPSHDAKLSHCRFDEPTRKSFAKWASAPAAVAQSPQIVHAASKLLAVTEDCGSGDDGDEMFDCVLAGSRRADRKTLKKQKSLVLGAAFSEQTASPERQPLFVDDDCDWLPGQVDASPSGQSPNLLLVGPLIECYSNSTPSPPPLISEASALEAFEDAISHVCTGDLIHIDLSSNGKLTHIPPSIADIRHATLLRLPPPTSPPLPTSLLQLPRSTRRLLSDRSKSSPTALFPPFKPPSSAHSKAPISIDLSNNPISSLPVELFSLQNLGLLSLRGCRLTEIPAAMCRLSQLRELNLSINRLSWLPAEMLQMMPQTIIRLAGNQWPNPPKHLLSMHDHKKGISLFPLQRKPKTTSDGIPTLRESCQRRLFTIRHHLRSSDFQFSLQSYSTKLLNEFCDFQVGVCNWCGTRFFEHVEERMQWAKVGNQMVPVKWRGCRRGCLDWLEKSAVI